ncbi:Hypothetical predicted protein, partial [Mytilus galloprovincialis]
SMNMSRSRLEHPDKTTDKIVRLVTENSKMKERNIKDSKMIDLQKSSIQRLEEQLEKRDRQSDIYEKMKSAEEDKRKAEEEADKYYDQYQKEEVKVSALHEKVQQKDKEIKQLQQNVESMVAKGFVKKDEKSGDEFRILKKKFTEVYNELQDTKKKVASLEREIGDKKLNIILLESSLKETEEKCNKKIKAYEESYEMLEDHKRSLKNQIRNLEGQINQPDDTIVNFQQSKKDSSLPLGKASSAGGAVDHFTNILLQEENRKLKQEKSKYEKKTEKLQHELQRLQKEKKENEHLEEKVAQLR